MKIEIFQDGELLQVIDWPVVPSVNDHYQDAGGLRYAVYRRTFSGSVSKPVIRLDVTHISNISANNGLLRDVAELTNEPPETAGEDGQDSNREEAAIAEEVSKEVAQDAGGDAEPGGGYLGDD